MPTTTRHAWPKPDLTYAPNVPADIGALADAVDLSVPFVSASAPAHNSGLIWFNPTTGLLRVSDGTAWNDPAPGRLAGTSRTSNSAAVSAEAVLTVNVSFTLAVARRVRWSFGGYATGSSAGTQCRITLRRNATGAAIATSDTRVQIAESTTGTGSATLRASDTELLSAGTYGYGLTIGPLGGGTAQLVAASDFPCTLEVFDAGPV